VSDSLPPNLTPQSVTSLPARDDIPLLALLENQLVNGTVSTPGQGTSSTIKVELGTELGSSGTRHPNKPIRFYVKKEAIGTCKRLT